MYDARNTVCLIVLFSIITSACGYRFTGTGGFPAGVNRIFINLYDNRTSETGIENFMRVDISITHVESDYVIRTVTGFIGEPIPVGSASQIWQPRGVPAATDTDGPTS